MAVDFTEAFRKIKDNTQKFKDKINSSSFQDKFRSPFAQPSNLASSEQAPESPEVIDYSSDSRQVTGPNTGISNPSPAPAETQAPAPANPAASVVPANPVNPTAPADVPGDMPTGKQIGNSNKDVANAQPGDWLIRSNGDKVVLTQAHIDWAKNKINGQGGKTSQAKTENKAEDKSENKTEDKGKVPPDGTMSSDASTESVGVDVHPPMNIAQNDPGMTMEKPKYAAPGGEVFSKPKPDSIKGKHNLRSNME